MYVFARFFSSASNENTPRKWRWHLLYSTSLDWLSLAIIQTTLEREICQNSDIVWLKIVSSSTLFELAVSCSHFSLFTSASLLVWNFCLINFNSITMISHTLYSDTVQNSRHPLGLMLLENSLKLSLLSVTMFTSNCRLTQFTILPSSQHSVFFFFFYNIKLQRQHEIKRKRERSLWLHRRAAHGTTSDLAQETNNEKLNK